ncbi:MAG TPA: hypothetical protein PLZ73_12565 [bacterium]|nr:hypothetical protein [bacterium]
MKNIPAAAAIMALATIPASAQEWALSTVLGDASIEALAVAPDGTAWAGQSNSVYRFDGSAWTCVTTLAGWTDFGFYGAAAPADDRACFSGFGYPPAGGTKSSVPTSIYLPIVLRRSGAISEADGGQRSANWWDINLRVAPWEFSAPLWATANGAGGYDVWAASWGGVYTSSDDGASWGAFTDSGIGYFSSVAGTGPSDIWLAGADNPGYHPCLSHYDGSGWTLHTTFFSGSTPRVCVSPGGMPYCAFTGWTMIGVETVNVARVFEFSSGSWMGLTEIPRHGDPFVSWSPQSHHVWLGTTFQESTSLPQTGGVFSYDGATWWMQTSLSEPVWAIDASNSGGVWAATTGVVYNLPWQAGRRSWHTDYDGDGTSDIGVFRSSTGMWAIRGVTRVYFGGSSDNPVPGDYNGDGTTDAGIFRNSTGMWAIRGVTRVYFGGSSDNPVPGDYSGDGTWTPGIHRASTGLWVIRGFTRAYFGGSSDDPVPGVYSGDGTWTPGIYRPTAGLWAIRGVTRVYFGGSSDNPVPGDYSGDGTWTPGIYRTTAGLWAVRGVTRVYFGGSSDNPVPGGYRGDGKDYVGVFRSTSGLWAIRGVTRTYFGGGTDIPVTR